MCDFCSRVSYACMQLTWGENLPQTSFPTSSCLYPCLLLLSVLLFSDQFLLSALKCFLPQPTPQDFFHVLFKHRYISTGCRLHRWMCWHVLNLWKQSSHQKSYIPTGFYCIQTESIIGSSKCLQDKQNFFMEAQQIAPRSANHFKLIF